MCCLTLFVTVKDSAAPRTGFVALVNCLAVTALDRYGLGNIDDCVTRILLLISDIILKKFPKGVIVYSLYVLGHEFVAYGHIVSHSTGSI